MNKVKKILSRGVFVILTTCSFLGCADVLDIPPQATLSPSQLQNEDGVEAALIGAYTMLNGNKSGSWNTYAAAPDLWLWGDIGADNAHKASDPGDQSDLFAIEIHTTLPDNTSLSEIWVRRFEGILRCNNVLKLLNDSPEVNSTERGNEIKAEARFLRGHYYFDLWKIFKYVPYVTDDIEDPSSVPNDHDIITDIEADFIFAEQNLPLEKPLGEVGRVDRIAAKAYLGKVYLYEEKYDDALQLFKDVISSKPDIEALDFRDNFDVTKRNGPESIFAVQGSVNDPSNGSRGNVGGMLSGPLAAGLPVSCCGFLTPTFDLVNSYRVDGQGLPLFDDFRSDYFPSSFDDNFVIPTDIAIDTRLDYTVGRQGIPYRDWGIMEGDSWIRNVGYDGPFISYKTITDASEIAAHTQAGASNISDLNINIIRLADVYLMAAECAVRSNQHDFNYALGLVNKIRNRANNLPKKKIQLGGSVVDAADYNVGVYNSFPNEEYAMKAIQWERRLELSFEGHRFFDLRRWKVLQSTLQEYALYESKKLDYVVPIGGGTIFEQNDFFYPIPQTEIDRSGGILKQHF